MRNLEVDLLKEETDLQGGMLIPICSNDLNLFEDEILSESVLALWINFNSWLYFKYFPSKGHPLPRPFGSEAGELCPEGSPVGMSKA